MNYIMPGPYRVLVQPSPVDAYEEERASGLIIKRLQREAMRLERGLVVRCGDLSAFSDLTPGHSGLPLGTLVFYLQPRAVAVGDLIIVSFEDIWAWEVED